jgi:hypothetical protein
MRYGIDQLGDVYDFEGRVVNVQARVVSAGGRCHWAPKRVSVNETGSCKSGVMKG